MRERIGARWPSGMAAQVATVWSIHIVIMGVCRPAGGADYPFGRARTDAGLGVARPSDLPRATGVRS